jgi:hypothetical protein
MKYTHPENGSSINYVKITSGEFPVSNTKTFPGASLFNYKATQKRILIVSVKEQLATDTLLRANRRLRAIDAESEVSTAAEAEAGN